MRTVEVQSYAKANLTLEVSARRSDGFHDIDSVVQVIDLADSLAISTESAGVIAVETDSPDVPSGEGNLVHRACRAFFDSTGVRGGARCVLTKRIPAQAGLGGGSGNAAAAILALDRLYETGLTQDDLIEIATSVGSDVPLFILGGTVRMRGRGDIVEPLPDAPELHLVIVKPDIGVSTAWAYAELDRLGDRRPTGASDIAERAVRQGDRAALIDAIQNDFEPVVTGAFGKIAECKSLLMQSCAERAMLCGSGSAVFGVFESSESAVGAAEALRGRVPWVAVARSIPRQVSD